jgi:hypothetical protein
VTLIHHYTDSGGLIGIIQSKTIRATNVRFMNDSVEATFGWERIERFLASKTPTSARENDVIQIALQALRGIRDADNLPDSYIACFSEKDNDLSQWRAYGHGRGFSIGFDSEELNQLARAISGSSSALPVIRKVAYTDQQQNLILQTNYEQQVLAQLNSSAATDALAGAFTVMAIMSGPALKHPAFQAEEEWRLQFFFEKTDQRIQFRDSAMGVTPYIDVPLCKPDNKTIDGVKEVRVGPQRHPEEALRAARQLLIRNGLESVEVKSATIPLRPS